MNFCGVVSNAFLVAFTSSWGNTFNTTDQVWIVVGFEVTTTAKSNFLGNTKSVILWIAKKIIPLWALEVRCMLFLYQNVVIIFLTVCFFAAHRPNHHVYICLHRSWYTSRCCPKETQGTLFPPITSLPIQMYMTM